MAGRLAVPNPKRSVRGRGDCEGLYTLADQARGRRVVIPQRVAVADQPANAVTSQPRAVGPSIEGQDPHRDHLRLPVFVELHSRKVHPTQAQERGRVRFVQGGGLQGQTILGVEVLRVWSRPTPTQDGGPVEVGTTVAINQRPLRSQDKSSGAVAVGRATSEPSCAMTPTLKPSGVSQARRSSDVMAGAAPSPRDTAVPSTTSNATSSGAGCPGATRSPTTRSRLAATDRHPTSPVIG